MNFQIKGSHPCFCVTAGLLLVCLLAGCPSRTPEAGNDQPGPLDAGGGIQSKPLAGRVPGNGGRFTELDGAETGLLHTNQLQPANMRRYLLNGAGMATGDFDNDGLVDVFAVSQDGENHLFRQTSTWKFVDVTAAAGGLAGGDYWGTGASFADVDNDGWLDLYVCNINGPNQLFINQQNGTFKEDARARGVAFAGATTMGSFADYDRDGDLDLYLVNNRIFSILEESPEVQLRPVNGRLEVPPDFQEQYFLLEGRIQEAGQRDRLLQNDGRGYFSDVTETAGIAGFDMGLSATWWDYDNDGWMDLYVANDMTSPDHLYRNLGNGQFQDRLPDSAGHTPWFSMGADSADINNDGLADLLIADMSSTTHYKQKTTMGEMGNSAWFLTIGRPRQFMRNTLLVNSGSHRFYEAANLTGLDSTDWSWSIKFADFDSDMLVDVFVTNGVGRNMNDSDAAVEYGRLMEAGKPEEAQAQILKMPPLQESNLVFRNRGDLEFENVSRAWGLDHVGVSQGACVADIDRDGDLDLLVSNMNEPLTAYRNDLAGNNLLVRLAGTTSNRFGVNAKITVAAGDTRQVRQINLARGYMSADEPLAHFGLGENRMVDRILVEWPSGICQEFRNVAGNQQLTITEGTSGQIPPPGQPAVAPWLEEVDRQSTGLDYKHVEIESDDYQWQPLLPNKLSQLGPGMAWGDVNGDGRQDLFLGNSASLPARLFIQEAPGQFVPATPWYDESPYEDLGAAFLDVDGDGDQDLYVASGGYDFEPGSEWLQDRLYLNDGQGNFRRAAGDKMPELRQSSSCVVPNDFDHDGDLDLFVGTRLVPRNWPLAGTSFLLENQDGKLVDVTAQRAPGLIDAGLVTGALWSDIDNDGWQDLVVALEWGPVRCLRNDQGQLVDRTRESGLEPYLGWWNSVASGDIDNDGDMDLVALNAGLNTKYHGSPEHPVQLFARDFDNNGTLDLVETEWEGDTCFPVRGKSCSSRAMPFLKEKFQTFHDFALADVSQIYTDTALTEADQFTATHLQSMIFLNNGQGQFVARDLPRLAQIAPGFGVALGDINGDGNLDLAIAQNFLHPQPETGQMDGGMGMVLEGDGAGGFRPLGPVESGVCVEGQGMSLTLADVDGDRAPDLVMAINDGPLHVWRNRSNAGRPWMVVELRGNPGNPTGIGSRVELETSAGRRRVYEVSGAAGYLSQSPAAVWCINHPDDPVTRIDVRWPDGQLQSQPVSEHTPSVLIEYPQGGPE